VGDAILPGNSVRGLLHCLALALALHAFGGELNASHEVKATNTQMNGKYFKNNTGLSQEQENAKNKTAEIALTLHLRVPF
jgi:hypothetical protein